MSDVKAPRDFSTERRDKMADKGVAMPDGSYPIPDKDALRRAIQSFGRAKNPDAVKAHIIKRAKALGATDLLPEGWGGAPAKGSDDVIPGKAIEVKAEEMTTSQLERWLKGETPRRILALPYGGLIPSDVSPIGVDRDREWFDEQTDHIGPYAALKATRDRMVDWHHTTFAGEAAGYTDPVGGTMKGAVLGRIVLDDAPDTVTLDRPYRGIWADWWMKYGDQGRRALIEEIEAAGGTLYGSTQPVPGGVVKSASGHIDVWPILRHTITTNPINHLAVVPSLKAVLTADLPFDEVGLAALKAALVGLDDLGAELRATSHGSKQSAKAQRLSSVLDEAEQLLVRLQAQATTRRPLN